MKLAVTGGAGFLGYHICRNLSSQFSEIRVLDVAPIESEEYPVNARYINMDVRNLDIEVLIESCDSFSRLKDINLAFNKRVRELELLIKSKRIELVTIEKPKIEQQQKYDRSHALKSLNNLMVNNRRSR